MMQQSFYDNSGKQEPVIPTSVPWMLFCGTGPIVITPEYIFCSSEVLSPASPLPLSIPTPVFPSDVLRPCLLSLCRSYNVLILLLI
jgi:hypothetical protein